MKRGTRPFIVEVRRGQKRAQPIEGEVDSNAFRNEALRRAEAALFGTSPGQLQTAKPESAPPPQEPRRILASLADAEPSAVLIAEPEPPRRRGRKPGKVQTGVEPARHEKKRLADRTAARSVPLTPELVNAALDKIEKATLAVPRRRAAGPSSLSQRPAAAGGAEKTLRVRRKKAAAPSRHAEGKAKRKPVDAAPPAPPPRSSEKVERVVQRPSRTAPVQESRSPRPSIRGRYVFGTELKPGERWKRRLRWRR